MKETLEVVDVPEVSSVDAESVEKKSFLGRLVSRIGNRVSRVLNLGRKKAEALAVAGAGGVEALEEAAEEGEGLVREAVEEALAEEEPLGEELAKAANDNDPEAEKKPVEKMGPITTETAISNAFEALGIQPKTIYYPGAGDHDLISIAFPGGEVTYLDKDPDMVAKLAKTETKVIEGDAHSYKLKEPAEALLIINTGDIDYRQVMDNLQIGGHLVCTNYTDLPEELRKDTDFELVSVVDKNTGAFVDLESLALKSPESALYVFKKLSEKSYESVEGEAKSVEPVMLAAA